MPPALLQAHVVGSSGGRSRAVDVMAGCGFECAETEALPKHLDAAALVCVVVDHPDQFASEEVRQFLGLYSGVRVICLLSDWCGALNRSRGDWPVSVTVDLATFPRRLEQELETIQGRRPALPMTAGRDEVAAGNHFALMPDSGRGRLACVVSADRDWRESLIDQLVEAGFTVSDEEGAEAALVVVDAGPDPARNVLEFQKLRASFPAARIVVLSATPESEVAVSDRALLVSKFAPVGEWLGRIASAMVIAAAMIFSGCGNKPAVSPAEVAPAKPTWAEQVAGVRSGKRTTVVASEPVTVSDWKLLDSGCAALTALEIESGEIVDSDLAVLSTLPHLKRLKLGIGVTDEGARRIAGQPAISELILPAAAITDQGVAAICRLPLVQLRLRTPNATDAAMTEIGKLTQLRFLHLIEVPISDAGLEPLVGLKTLESLYLDGAKCTDEGLSAFLKRRPDIHFHRDQMHLKDDANRHAH